MNTARLSHKRSTKGNRRKPVVASSGLKQWMLPRLTQALLDEATLVEYLSGPEEGQVIIAALDGSTWGRNILRLWNEVKKMDDVAEEDALLAIFRSGFGLGLRAVDLAMAKSA